MNTLVTLFIFRRMVIIARYHRCPTGVIRSDPDPVNRIKIGPAGQILLIMWICLMVMLYDVVLESFNVNIELN